MSVRAAALIPIEWPPQPMAMVATPKLRLKVTPVKQEMDNWCWAACIDMAREQQELKDEKQIKIVKDSASVTCTTSCNLGCPPEQVAQAFVNNGLARTVSAGPVEQIKQVDRQQLVAQLGQGDSGNCVAIGLEHSGLKKKHMVLVVGYPEPAGNKVLVIDPGGPDKQQESEKSMSELAAPQSDGSAAGAWQWKWTWLDLRR